MSAWDWIHEHRKGLRNASRLAFFGAGVVVVYLLGREVGWRELSLRLLQVAPWFPLVMGLEFVRLFLDALTSYYGYGQSRAAISWSLLARAQLIGSAAGSILPAGRASEEATKAALLSPYLGGGESFSAAATNQAATLIATGIISVPCTLAAWLVSGFSTITLLLTAHTLVVIALGVALRGGMNSMRLLEWVKRRFRRLEAYAEHFQNTALSVGGVFPVRPVLCQTASRGLQVVQFAILAVAVGVDLTLVQAFFLQGIHLVSLALGAFVPAQAGVTEGTFILSASQVGITRLQAMTIALTTHAIQAVLIVCGILVPFVWKVRRPEKNTPETSWNRLSVSGRR